MIKGEKYIIITNVSDERRAIPINLTNIKQKNVKNYFRAGEMVQWFRTLATLPEDRDFIPSSYMAARNLLLILKICV